MCSSITITDLIIQGFISCDEVVIIQEVVLVIFNAVSAVSGEIETSLFGTDMYSLQSVHSFGGFF